MKQVIYKRKVNFYETDAQGIVHHSNYLRYFEEARGYFLEQLDLPYHIVRNEYDVDIVLLEVNVKYKRFLEFGDRFEIITNVNFKNKYYFDFEYKIINRGSNVCSGYTKHCCINKNTKKIITIPKFLKDRVI